MRLLLGTVRMRLGYNGSEDEVRVWCSEDEVRVICLEVRARCREDAVRVWYSEDEVRVICIEVRVTEFDFWPSGISLIPLSCLTHFLCITTCHHKIVLCHFMLPV